VIRAVRFPSPRTEAGYAATYCTCARPAGQSGLRADPQPARRTHDLVAGRRRACAAPAGGCRPLATRGRRRPRAAVASRTGGRACRHRRDRRSRGARWPQRRWPAAARDRRRPGRRRGGARLRRLGPTIRQRQSAAGTGGPHEPAAGAGKRWRAAAVVELVRPGRHARAHPRGASAGHPGGGDASPAALLLRGERPPAERLERPPLRVSPAQRRALREERRPSPRPRLGGGGDSRAGHLAMASDPIAVNDTLLDLERALSGSR
jgi:hypothetical protein